MSNEYEYYEYEEYPDWTIDETMKDKGEIYLITNTVNEKVYIGQTKCWRKNKRRKDGLMKFGSWKRLQRHISDAFSLSEKKGNGCPKLFRAIRKYGSENFTIEILCRCPLKYLNENEIYYIDLYDSVNNDVGYNVDLGGAFNAMANPEVAEKAAKKNRENFKDPVKRKELINGRRAAQDRMVEEGRVRSNKNDEQDLPQGISLIKNRPRNDRPGLENGYYISFSYQDKRKTAKITDTSLTMEQKLVKAKNKLNEMRIAFGLQPFQNL